MKTLFDVIESTNSSLVDDYERRAEGEIVTSNTTTGITSVDETGMGERGILTIIQAQAGEGKSTWARLLLESAVKYAGLDCIFYPFEDPEYQIGLAYTASEMGVGSWDLRRGAVTGNVIERIGASTDSLRWAERVSVETAKVPHDVMLRQLDLAFAANPKLRFAVVDYLQAFDAEDDEKSVERVVARVTWGLAELAKKYNATVYAFSQVKADVRSRGKAIFDGYVKHAQFKGIELEPSEELVVGFRPGRGDGQWSTALYHYAKDIRSWWRPNNWLREMGFTGVKDNYGLLELTKANFVPADLKPVRLAWNGGISEWKKKH